MVMEVTPMAEEAFAVVPAAKPTASPAKLAALKKAREARWAKPKRKYKVTPAHRAKLRLNAMKASKASARAARERKTSQKGRRPARLLPPAGATMFSSDNDLTPKEADLLRRALERQIETLDAKATRLRALLAGL